MLAFVTASLMGFGLVYLSDASLAGEQPQLPALPGIPQDRPLTVLVRGWLWDPSSRRVTAPLSYFPEKVNEELRRDHGIETDFVQLDWTRVPKDVFTATQRFTAFARRLGDAASDKGVCVNFVGHSAGAMMIYWAAAEGTPMGYMGTLGLPTFGARRPPSVDTWSNFYTSTHVDDIAGWAWGSRIGSDRNINLRMPHRDFWGAEQVHLASAEGIAQAWERCGAHAAGKVSASTSSKRL